ncbi:NadS family protein [Halomonas vilamensis]|uniref:NadS family protein n=1 Tax=Vreelandella vilamensis TaxID=531309 RepID=A0ABU1H045_9GAMM|nr:NadS family protein [Halomonas vilamensis]MDR5897674.1 NadS family protein [Halomonas vilamensis]
MGTSVETIKSWETKRRNPPGLAAKVLTTIQNNPAFFNKLASLTCILAVTHCKSYISRHLASGAHHPAHSAPLQSDYCIKI